MPKFLLGITPFAAISLLLAATSHADVLETVAGDLIQGQLKTSDETNVIWTSASFGELTLARDQVKTINGQPLAASQAEPDVVIAEAVDEAPAPLFHKYKGDLSVTAAYANGNQDRRDVDVQSSVEWYQGEAFNGDWRHKLGVNYESHSLDGSDPMEEYELAYNSDWFYDEKWFWSNGLTAGADDNRAIDQRYTVASGIGYQFWREEFTALSAKSGALYIVEDYQDGTSNNHLTWEWSLDYSTRLLGKLDFVHNHQLLVSTEDTDDSEARANFSLRAPLIEKLFTELKYELIYDNQPVAGAKHLDEQLTLGVNYSW